MAITSVQFDVSKKFNYFIAYDSEGDVQYGALCNGCSKFEPCPGCNISVNQQFLEFFETYESYQEKLLLLGIII